MKNITKMENNKLEFTDLMVGDYIFHVNEHVGGSVDLIISKVKEVHEHKIVTEYDLIAHEYEIEPIVLAPKMLDEFGFRCERDNILECYYYVSSDKRIQIRDFTEDINEPNNFYIHIDDEDMDSIFHAEINYVHELQHILKFVNYKSEDINIKF